MPKQGVLKKTCLCIKNGTIYFHCNTWAFFNISIKSEKASIIS